ncbi:MAG: hypothetical protein H3C62_01770 [Gemmatimonadaceae bacterium]|nr:hypothetical protein [Gemmatimonadaceae bacterium]
MTQQFVLDLPCHVHEALWTHLLADSRGRESAAFAFVRPGAGELHTAFKCVEWFPVPEAGFTSRSAVHLELTDSTRASVIKRAHLLDASIVEFHSHTGPWPASFSPSDLAGFKEFVPHVRWRLKGRPYVAIVVAGDGFDGFVWAGDDLRPKQLDAIRVDAHVLDATKLTYWNGGDDE